MGAWRGAGVMGDATHGLDLLLIRSTQRTDEQMKAQTDAFPQWQRVIASFRQ
jgi:hypothetical protein